jgi:hypothetical protein
VCLYQSIPVLLKFSAQKDYVQEEKNIQYFIFFCNRETETVFVWHVFNFNNSNMWANYFISEKKVVVTDAEKYYEKFLF